MKIINIIIIVLLLRYTIKVEDSKLKIRRAKLKDNYIVLICILMWIAISKLTL